MHGSAWLLHYTLLDTDLVISRWSERFPQKVFLPLGFSFLTFVNMMDKNVCTMVITLDGNSEIGAHVWSVISNLIC